MKRWTKIGWAALAACLLLATALIWLLDRRLEGDRPDEPEVTAAQVVAVPPEVDGCGAGAPRGEVRAGGLPGADSPFRETLSGFELRFADERSPLALLATTVAVGRSLTVEAAGAPADHRFEATADGGELRREGSRRWHWVPPPRPGVQCLRFTDLTSGGTARLNAFVAVPYDGENEIDGYPIGSYERLPLDDLPAYEMPGALIQVTDETMATWVSPRFRLSQFVPKDDTPFPRYMVLSERLLLKLERLLDEVNAAGIPASTFFLVSGYRTPHYNRAIGNKTTYSRHCYGDAADFFVDEDGDGVMDDLDGDGRVDLGDARVLQRIVDAAANQRSYGPFIGGLGLYPPNPVRGPFVHVDTRGYATRW
jgi:hypothetical protein